MNQSARTKIEIIANRLKEYDRKSTGILNRKKDKKDYSFSIKVVTEEGDNPLVICERATGYMNFNKFMDFALQKSPYQIVYDEFDGDSPESKKRKDLSVRINLSEENLTDEDELAGIDDDDDSELVDYQKTPLERRIEMMSQEPAEKVMTERDVKRMLRSSSDSNKASLGKLQEALEAIEKQRHQIEIQNLNSVFEWEKRRLQDSIDKLTSELASLKSQKEEIERECSELEKENDDLAAKVKDFEEGGSLGRLATSAEKLLPVFGPALAGIFPGLKGLSGPVGEMPAAGELPHGNNPRQEQIDLVVDFINNLSDVDLSNFIFIISRMMANPQNILAVKELLN